MEIQGFSDYLIYEDGRVFSKKSNIFMKQSKNRDGYLQLCLSNRGKPMSKTIHRLIAEYYIPNPENKPEVDHIDRDKINNNIENLRWVSSQENSENRGLRNDNKSGHKNIYWGKSEKKWTFEMRGRYKIRKRFNSKIDCICYKFYYLLKINYNNKKFDS